MQQSLAKTALAADGRLTAELTAWLRSAQAAGLDAEDLTALSL